MRVCGTPFGKGGVMKKTITVSSLAAVLVAAGGERGPVDWAGSHHCASKHQDLSYFVVDTGPRRRNMEP